MAVEPWAAKRGGDRAVIRGRGEGRRRSEVEVERSGADWSRLDAIGQPRRMERREIGACGDRDPVDDGVAPGRPRTPNGGQRGVKDPGGASL